MAYRNSFDVSSPKDNAHKQSPSSANKLVLDVEQCLTSDAASRDELVRSLLEFGYHYFPDYCALPASSFHKQLCAELEDLLEDAGSQRRAYAAPRGTAKSTWVSLIFILYCVVFEKKNYIIVVTATAPAAEKLMRDIKTELETNEFLAADFPNACGRGSIWRSDEIHTQNNIRIEALGAKMQVRGRRHGHHRPDLLVIDDLENDDQVRNPAQRDGLHEWINKALLKSKGLAQKADFIVIGTILHYDSVLARLLDPLKSPGWHGRVFRSVISWSPRQDLWDRWQELYTDWRSPTHSRLASARAFFEDHQEEMIADTAVLWPEAETYYDLMCLRIDEGPTSFDSEKQNQPIDPATCLFPEVDFQWVVLTPADADYDIVPERGARIRLSDCDTFAACDPSMGRLDKHGDPSAIVAVAAYPSRRLGLAEEYQQYFCIEASICRRHPKQILDDLLEMHRRLRFQVIGVEAIQFQELFADLVKDAIARDPILETRVRKLKPHSDKLLRIQSLSSRIFSGRLQFNRKLTELFNQFRYFPHAAHDDGPDALAMCFDVMSGPTVRFLPLDQLGEDEDVHPYTEQMRRNFPFDLSHPDPHVTCGNCFNVDRGGHDGRLFCPILHQFVTTNLPCCELYSSDPGQP